MTAWRVCSFESRKADEMRALIARHGGVATIAPSMQELPLEENHDALKFAQAVLDGQVDIVVFMTGVGARTLFDSIATVHDRSQFLEALSQCWLVVRGPKPTAVLRDWQLRIDLRAPEPNTWRELLQVMDEHIFSNNTAPRTVAVQEYGLPNQDFYQALQQRGAQVVRVPVYRWGLPDDTGPLEDAVRGTIDGRFDVLMFTSAVQLNNVVQMAEHMGVRPAWLAAAARCVVASIGPTASETIRACGLPVDLEPQHPKMGHLVRETIEAAELLLAPKRRDED